MTVTAWMRRLKQLRARGGQIVCDDMGVSISVVTPVQVGTVHCTWEEVEQATIDVVACKLERLWGEQGQERHGDA